MITEPQQIVLKGQEETVGGDQGHCKGTGWPSPRTPLECFMFLLPFKIQACKAHVWDVQNVDGTGKHLDSGQIKAREYEFLELGGSSVFCSLTVVFLCVQGFYK